MPNRVIAPYSVEKPKFLVLHRDEDRSPKTAMQDALSEVCAAGRSDVLVVLDPELVGKGAPFAELSLSAGRAPQVLPFQERLQHQRQQRVVHVDAEALMMVVAEMDIVVGRALGIEPP